MKRLLLISLFIPLFIYGCVEQSSTIIGLISSDDIQVGDDGNSGNSVNPVDYILNDIEIGGTRGLIVGDGIIFRTLDGGDTWSSVLTSSFSYKSVTNATSSDVYAVGGDGNIVQVIKSSDGGENWDEVFRTDEILNESQEPTDIYRIVDRVVLTYNRRSNATRYGVTCVSEDAGINWSCSEPGPTINNGIYSIGKLGSYPLLLGGKDRAFELINTTTSNQIMLDQNLSGTIISGIALNDKNNGLLAGNGSFFILNQGIISSKIDFPNSYEVNDIQYVSGPSYMAVGNNGLIISTTDEGSTWSLVNSGTTNNLYAITRNNLDMWIVGEEVLIKMDAIY